MVSTPWFRAMRYHPHHQCHPRGFSPPRRFWPTESPGFVAPQYRTGFAEFPILCDPHPKMLACHASSQSALFTPFEAFPSLVAVLHHCSRCPLDVRRVNVPLASLTANAAFIRPGSRQPSGQPPFYRLAIFPIARLHIPRFDHRRVSSPTISNTLRLRATSCMLRAVFHPLAGWKARS